MESENRAGYLRIRHRSAAKWIVLLIGMICFKLATEAGYYFLLSGDQVTYPLDFNCAKYIVGWAWCILLFFGIRHGQKKVSTFMLYVVFLVQIVPITCVFALANDSALFYNLTCLAFLCCEFLCQVKIKKITFRWPKPLKNWMLLSFAAALAALMIIIFVRNGLPGLTALNIYNVYDLRSSGVFQLGKYGQYLLEWMMAAIVPFLMAWTIVKRRYFLALLLCVITLALYLYTGMKSYLFGVPLVVVCALWIRRKNAYNEIFSIVPFCFGGLVAGTCLLPMFYNVLYRIYSLFGRRMMLVSAVNKFKYFDFFSQNPKMGLAGVFPRWFININNPYGDQSIGNIIASVYYNQPDMNSNTGFLAEGYMRFGIAGIFINLMLFMIILRLMDRMQDRAGYALTVSAFIFPVMILTDSHLFDSLVLGPWMVIVIILLVYRERKTVPEEKEMRETSREKAESEERLCNSET